MSLSDFASIASIASGLAVVVSLIYLGLQTHQAAKNQRGTMHQMRAALSTDVMLRIAEEGLLPSFRAGVSGSIDISEEQFWQFFYAASAILRTTENAYTQHQDGLISDAHFASSQASARSFLAAPGYRALWQATRLSRENGFRDYMDGLAKETAIAPAADVFAAWKSLLQKPSGA